MNDIVTSDLSQYGYMELAEAGELLKAYGNDGAEFLEDGITLNFNTQSGKVFLSDSDFNVGVIEAGKLVQFLSCPECGYEGTQADAESEGKDFEKYLGYCSKECAKKNE